ncbi:MAG: metallophosphoesterase [Bradymonadaceae bacterium]
MKLGHISDLHLLDLREPHPRDFMNKRFLGGVNLLLNRGDDHSAGVVREALDHLEQRDVDHIAITGDLTNLALESEFAAVADLLAEIPSADGRVSVVPGNHDYYTPDAVEAGYFEKHFAPYLESDLPEYQLERGYPFCKLIGDVALVGMNTGVPTPWFFATGEVGDHEIEATEALLEDPEIRDRFTVVMLHHHLVPFEHSRVEFTRRLVNASDVLDLLRRHRVELAIHGHNHHFATIEIPHLEGDGALKICEAGSTSLSDYRDPKFGGKYNIYHIHDGRLDKIETHLYEGEDLGFVRWRERTFEKAV